MLELIFKDECKLTMEELEADDSKCREEQVCEVFRPFCNRRGAGVVECSMHPYCS